MRALLLASFLSSGCTLLFNGDDLHGKGGGTDGFNGNVDMAGEDLSGGGGGPDMTIFYGCGSDAGASMVTTKATSYPTGNGSYDVAVADLDGDGYTDVAVSNKDSNNVSILWNQKDGTFGAPTQLPTANGPREIWAADVSGDGKPDIEVACDDGTTSKLSVLINSGGRAFAAVTTFSTAPGSYGLAAADFNKDGKIDLATLSESGDTIRVFTNTGAAPWFPTGLLTDSNICPTTGHCANNGAANAYGIASADVDNDGYIDLVTANYSDDSLSVLHNDKTGKFPQASIKSFAMTNAGVWAGDVTTGDPNHDGKIDLVVSNGRFVVVAINDGTGGFPTTMQQSYDAGMETIAGEDLGHLPITPMFADMNGDGLLDIVTGVFNDASTMGNFLGYTEIFLQRSGGTFDMPITTKATLGANSLRVGDFDNDCRPDFVIPNLNPSGTVDVWLNTSTH
jgi:hypothetical protein